MENRVYRPLKNYSIEEIKRILSEDNHDELMLLPLSAGEYFRDWHIGENARKRYRDDGGY